MLELHFVVQSESGIGSMLVFVLRLHPGLANKACSCDYSRGQCCWLVQGWCWRRFIVRDSGGGDNWHSGGGGRFASWSGGSLLNAKRALERKLEGGTS